MPPKNQGNADDDSGRDTKRPDDPPLQKLGKYTIERQVGSGGMGTVYAAIDQDLKRRVALKILPKDKAENPTLVKRFKAEARSGAQLEHQNIIRVYESGQIDGQLFMALEFVDGLDLLKLIHKRGRIPPKRSIEIIKQTCQALQHAYKANVVHRDIKPSNLMITNDGTVKLADMGLARIIDETLETIITRAGTTVGTVDYMAPEQARDSKEADIRSDIYSLGCTWYHMLTGSLPFPEGSMTNKLHAHATKAPPDPRHIVDTIPASIVAVIQKMMAKKKQDRYHTPAELLEELSNSNLKRAEISGTSLEALAQEAEENTPVSTRKGVSSSEVSDEEDELPLPAKTKKSKSKEKSKSPNETESAPGKKKKAAPAKDDKDKFQFDIKPIALITFIAVAVGIGYGIITLVKGFGEVFDNNYANMNNNKDNQLKDNDAGQPAPAGNSDGTITPDANSTIPDNANINNKNDKSPDSPFSQDEFGTRDERLGQSLEELAKQLAGHVDYPLPETKITLGKPDSRIPVNESIFSALDRFPRSGGVIEFADDGPYIITQTIPVAKDRIVLTAASGKSPILLYQPANAKPGPMWHITRGELQLRGVHLSVNPKLAEEFKLPELINVNGGMFSLIDSSIVLQGETTTDFAAIGLNNTTTPAVCYLARSSIRGNKFTAIKNKSQDSKIIIGDSLLASGSAPVISQSSTAGRPATSLHDLILDHSILVAQNNIFTFENISVTDKPSSHRMRTQFSVLGNTENHLDSHLLKCLNWPVADKKSAETEKVTSPAPQIQNYLIWENKESCLAGWDKPAFYKLQDAPFSKSIVTVDDWNQHFKVRESNSFIVDYHFPVMWSQNPQKLNTDSITSSLSATSITIAEKDKLLKLPLKYPQLLPMEKLRVSELKLNPKGKFNTNSTTTIHRCDLATTDLGDFLSNPNLPNGVIVEVVGAGTRLMKPCKIAGKTVNLLFPSSNRTGGVSQPIIKQKTVALSFVRPDSPEKYEALFELDNSELNIVGGHFQLPSSNKEAVVNWFIRSKGSTFSLQGTYLEGPMSDSPSHRGLIYLKNSNKPNQCYITESFLRTSGSAFKIDDPEAKLLLNKSIVAGLNSVLDYQQNAGTFNSINAAAVEFESSTLASSDQIFKLEFSETQSTTPPLAILASNSVFSPGLVLPGKQSGGTSLLMVNKPIEKIADHLSWWGQNNGYANDLRLDFSNFKQPLDSQWKKLWNDDREISPITGNNSAFLSKDIDNPANLTPGDLLLHANSLAATAGAGKKTLGADVNSLQMKKPDGSGSTPKNPTPNKPNNPNQPRPMF